jgi:hypothetical protein
MAVGRLGAYDAGAHKPAGHQEGVPIARVARRVTTLGTPLRLLITLLTFRVRFGLIRRDRSRSLGLIRRDR